jgi:hypothetical protein
MNEKQPEALKLADDLDACSFGPNKIAALLRTQHADIERKDALLRQALDAVENVNTTMPFLVAHELRQAITKELAK